jgi:excisionase family DNA binding protein
MNKREAAEELGCSTRQVEKYVGTKRLRVVEYVRGKSGREGVYDAKDVARLKAELEAEKREVIGRPAQSSALAPRPAQGQAFALAEQIAEGIGAQREDAARVASLLETIRDALTNGRASLADVDLKLTLSVAEAAQLSGFSRESLREAINAGTLKAKTVKGRRGWTIKRGDLDAYVKKL